MTQTLNVEEAELLARATELEVPMPVAPPNNPQAPCGISFITDAATQLALSADSIRLYLKICEREWQRMAQSLRNAAKAYEEVDEGAAEAVASNSSGSAVTSGVAGGDTMMINCDPDEDYYPPPQQPAPPPFEYPYYEVRPAATAMEAPDQGAAFTAFAKDWDAYQRKLQETAVRFRPFSHWEGIAATAVTSLFQEYRTYLDAMVTNCTLMAKEANTVAAAHKWAITEHPSAYEVSEADKWYRRYAEDPYYNKYYMYQVMEWYAKMQAKSEEVLAEYLRRAAVPLPPKNPKNPPTALKIDPPPPPPPKPEPEPEPQPEPEPEPEPVPEDDLPTEDDDVPAVPTTPSAGTPTTPSAGMSGMPDNSALTDALEGLSANSAAGVGSGMKAASVGGLGGGGGGMPAMPMQPAVDPEAARGGPSAGRDPGNLGRMAPAGAGAGGGGMGMAPMGAGGAGGAGQGGDKQGKHAQGTEESLYSEDRPWTEAVIGNRRRKDVSDSKDSK